MSVPFPTLCGGIAHPDAWPCRIRVAGQSEARRFYPLWQPSHVLSIVTPGRNYLGPRDVPAERHLVLSFDEDGAGGPTLADVDAILAFTDDLPGDAALLVHSLQGVNRAPAATLGILARRLGVDAVAALAAGCTQPPDPSPALVALFDGRLDLGGALLKATANRFVSGSQTLRRRSLDGDERFGGVFDPDPETGGKRAAG